ncbi:ATP-binding protein [Granulicella sp. S156]|jgi:signal transduction histidine kinase|uniref:sensor histidine kinase n=1 Tax=Granulicella sp. S156 TaxID=1747224 RepID=UPI00131C0A1D|nr:ATP-binding protein [Granulicella sp. S156]
MKKSDIYRLLMAGAILVVLLNTWMAWRSLSKLFTTQGWLSQTLDVLSHTESLALNMRTADSAVRGYILTGSPAFEKQYHASSQGVYAEIDEVQRLTADSESQQQRIAYLRTRVAAKMGTLDSANALRSGNSSAGPIEPNLLEPLLTDYPGGGQSVAYAISQIEAEEHRLLIERTRETKNASKEVWISFIAVSLLDILLIAAAFEQLVRAHRSHLQIAEDAASIEALNNELTRVNTELEGRVEERTQELAESNQELEAFSYSVSHDLRAPLRTIDGFSLALMEDFSDKLNDEGLDYIARIRNGVQRMGMLIDSLLQLSRVTRSEVHRERVDISQLAKLVFDELTASDHDRAIVFVAQPGVLAQADPRLVRIALENLIGNAWKFTSRTPEGRIEFGSDVREGRTVYFIRDNGAGFDMQYVDRLFTAFQRLHGDRDFKGSGIGLATVSRIIRRHQGSIWAESELGNGATFFFTLAA